MTYLKPGPNVGYVPVPRSDSMPFEFLFVSFIRRYEMQDEQHTLQLDEPYGTLDSET